MQAYKFDTRISEKGVILLPYEPKLFNTNVEIIILPKLEPKAKKPETEYTANDFISEYSGYLKKLQDKDPDDLRYEYLKKKYHIHSNDSPKEDLEEVRYKYLTKKYK